MLSRNREKLNGLALDKCHLECNLELTPIIPAADLKTLDKKSYRCSWEDLLTFFTDGFMLLFSLFDFALLGQNPLKFKADFHLNNN